MNVIWSVTKELLDFVFLEGFGFFIKQALPKTAPLALSSPTSRELLVGSSTPYLIGENTQAVKSDGSSVQYVKELEIYVYEQPVQVLDGAIHTLYYGTPVNVVLSSGRWSNIHFPDGSGWILKDGLVDNLKAVEPQFLLGEFYDFNNPETVKLRHLIADEFKGGSQTLPLQAVEFVTYSLRSRSRRIKWPEVRPRSAGRWQKILSGWTGIHIGVNPKTGAVMELINEESEGHVAYVEAVFPDQSILISEVGFPESGHYSERTLPYKEWRELRPVFIEITGNEPAFSR